LFKQFKSIEENVRFACSLRRHYPSRFKGFDLSLSFIPLPGGQRHPYCVLSLQSYAFLGITKLVGLLSFKKNPWPKQINNFCSTKSWYPCVSL